MSSLWGGNKIKPPVEKCHSLSNHYPSVFGSNQPDSPDSSRTRGTRITRLSDRSDGSIGSHQAGSHRQSTDRLHDHQSYIFHNNLTNQRINSIYDESDRASSCNTRISGKSHQSHFSTKSDGSNASQGSMFKQMPNDKSNKSNKNSFLKTMKSDVKEAAYEGCLMDGPLGPAITEKDKRQRKFLILGFVCAAFVAILCLALKEVGYNNGLTKLIESKAKEEVQLEQLQEAMFQNNMNKIEQILRASSGLQMKQDFGKEINNQKQQQPEISSESQTVPGLPDKNDQLFSNLALPSLTWPFFGGGAASNRGSSADLGPNLGPSLENIDQNNYPVPSQSQNNNQNYDRSDFSDELSNSKDDDDDQENIMLPRAAPLISDNDALTLPDLANKEYDPQELLAFLQNSESFSKFKFQLPKNPSTITSENSNKLLETKIDGSMNDITTMLDSFLNELYVLIEDFLNDSQNVVDSEKEERPDLAALFLAKQEKQIMNLMKGEEEHLSKRLDSISEKSLNRAGKLRGKLLKGQNQKNEDDVTKKSEKSVQQHISDLLNKKIDLMRDQKKKLESERKIKSLDNQNSDPQQKNSLQELDNNENLYAGIKKKLKALADGDETK